MILALKQWIAQATPQKYELLNSDCMQNQLECQQLLAARLKASWVSVPIDRTALSKTLRLSTRQLLALETGEDGAFHTRGLYLRAIEQALQEAGLKDDPEVVECLACLHQHYAQTPRGSQIYLVQQTVNKRLAIAPKDPSERAPIRIGAFGVVMVIVALVVVAVVVSTIVK